MNSVEASQAGPIHPIAGDAQRISTPACISTGSESRLSTGLHVQYFPCEILADIFDFCIGEGGINIFGDTSIDAPFVFALVCSSWRAALRSPHLWTRFQIVKNGDDSKLYTALPILKWCISRSSSLPLSFCLRIPWILTYPSPSSNATVETEILDYLMQYQGRWHEVDADLTRINNMSASTPLTGMKHLKSFKWCAFNTGPTSVDIGESFQLRNPSIEGTLRVHDVRSVPRFEHLRSLSIHPRAQCPCGTVLCVKLLPLVPVLEELHVHILRFDPAVPLEETQTRSHATLTQLSTFHFSFGDYRVSTHILNAMTCPNMKVATIYLSLPYDLEVGEDHLNRTFLDFLERSNPPLSHFGFTTENQTRPNIVQHLTSYLQLLPTAANA